MDGQARTALAGAAAGVVLLFATWWAAFHVGVFEHADQSILQGFVELGRDHGRLRVLATHVAKLCDPDPYVFLAAVPIAMALGRKRPRVALAVAAILLGANVTTHLLKPLLAEPRAAWLLGGSSPVGPGSWPSGHATAAMSLALTCVLAAPSRLRPAVAAIGAAFAVAVSYSFLALGWHYPSDVLGGYLVAATWSLLTVAALSLTAGTARQVGAPGGGFVSLRAALAPPAAVCAAALGLVVLVALARPRAVVSYAQTHEAFVLGAPAIGVLGLVLATGIALALRR